MVFLSICSRLLTMAVHRALASAGASRELVEYSFFSVPVSRSRTRQDSDQSFFGLSHHHISAGPRGIWTDEDVCLVVPVCVSDVWCFALSGGPLAATYS